MRGPLSFVLVLVLSGCLSAPSPSAAARTGTIEVTVTASPVCPVETEEPDPECDPSRVADARILVHPADGRDTLVGQGTTDEEGMVRIELPPGDYVVSGGAVDGLMGQPEPVMVTVAGTDLVSVTLAYDTGIR